MSINKIRFIPMPGALAFGFLVICLSSILSSPRAFAVEVAEPSRIDQAPIPNAFGQSGSIQLAPGSGSVSDSLRLSVPSARRGFEPKLSLSYASSAGLGLLGRGWSLGGLGHVENYTGDGVYLNRFYELGGILSSHYRSYGYQLNGQGGEMVSVGGED